MPTLLDGEPLARRSVHLICIRDALVLLSPPGWLRVSEEIRTGAAALKPCLGASQAGNVFLSHVSARAIEAVCLLMADSLDLGTLIVVIP